MAKNEKILEPLKLTRKDGEVGISAGWLISIYMTASKEAKSYANYQSLQTQSALINFIQQTQAMNTRYAQEQEATANHDMIQMALWARKHHPQRPTKNYFNRLLYRAKNK